MTKADDTVITTAGGDARVREWVFALFQRAWKRLFRGACGRRLYDWALALVMVGREDRRRRSH